MLSAWCPRAPSAPIWNNEVPWHSTVFCEKNAEWTILSYSEHTAGRVDLKHVSFWVLNKFIFGLSCHTPGPYFVRTTCKLKLILVQTKKRIFFGKTKQIKTIKHALNTTEFKKKTFYNPDVMHGQKCPMGSLHFC